MQSNHNFNSNRVHLCLQAFPLFSIHTLTFVIVMSVESIINVTYIKLSLLKQKIVPFCILYAVAKTVFCKVICDCLAHRDTNICQTIPEYILLSCIVKLRCVSVLWFILTMYTKPVPPVYDSNSIDTSAIC